MTQRSLVAAPLLAVLLFGSSPIRAQDPHWFDAAMVVDGPALQRLVGDFDLDGDLDVLAFDVDPGTLRLTAFEVRLNDGAARFTAGPSTALPPGGAVFCALGDVGGDGLLDLVLSAMPYSGHGNEVLVLPGLPGGTFGTATVLAVSAPPSLLAGDANGDGRADLFAQFGLGNSIESRWLFGNPDHTLTPGAPAPVPFRPAGTIVPFPALAYPSMLADVDGDGGDDVVVSRTDFPIQLELFVTSGNTLVAGPVLQPGSTGLLGPATSIDVDGDSDLDLVAPIGSSLYSNTLKFENLGGGAWANGTTLLALPTGGAARILAGDLDGDGARDLVVQADSWSWLRRTGSASFGLAGVLPLSGEAPVDCRDFDGDGRDDLMTSRAIVLGEGPFLLQGQTQANLIGDFDGDGDLDRIRPYDVEINDGTGRGTSTPTPFWFDPTGVYGLPWVSFGDPDGDGLTEFAFGFTRPGPGQTTEVHRMREQGDGSFVDVGLVVPPGAFPFAPFEEPVFEDFDGDSDLDITSQETVWLNDGTGFHTASGVVFSPGATVLAHADVDGDGDFDLLCVDQPRRNLLLCTRTGPVSYATTVLFAGTASATAGLPFPAVFADLDDDGDADVAGVRLTAGSPVVAELLLFDNQNGVLVPAGTLPFGGPIAAGDVDGDGMTDLCVGQGGYLTVLRRVGPGLAFAPPVKFLASGVRKLVDVDQDGDLDGWNGRVIASRRLAAPASGSRRQYGIGSQGTDHRRPLLSIVDPIRPGLVCSIRLREVPGGTFALLMLADAPADAPSIVFPGVHDYVANVALILGFATGGATGVAGTGAVDLPVAIPATAAGLDLFFEFLVFDAAVPGFLTNSNGCEMHVGQ